MILTLAFSKSRILIVPRSSSSSSSSSAFILYGLVGPYVGWREEEGFSVLGFWCSLWQRKNRSPVISIIVNLFGESWGKKHSSRVGSFVHRVTKELPFRFIRVQATEPRLDVQRVNSIQTPDNRLRTGWDSWLTSGTTTLVLGLVKFFPTRFIG